MGHGGPGGPDGGRGQGFGGAGDIPEALAKLSGKDASTIMQQRAAGKSFAQIAKAYGVSTDELLAETVKIEKAELDAAVKAGTLTDAQRTRDPQRPAGRPEGGTDRDPRDGRPRVRPGRR